MSMMLNACSRESSAPFTKDYHATLAGDITLHEALENNQLTHVTIVKVSRELTL